MQFPNPPAKFVACPFWALLVLVILGGFAPPADAQSTRRIAVLITRAGGNVPADLAETINEVWIAALAGQAGIELLGRAELQSQLGQSEQEALRCAASVTCLGHVGATLGADALVIGSLGRQGAEYRLDVNLIDIATGRVASRRVERIPGGIEALARRVRQLAPELLREPPRPASLHAVTRPEGADAYVDEVRVGTTPLRLVDVRPGRHAVRFSLEGYRTERRTIEVSAGAAIELDVPLTALPRSPEAGTGWWLLFWSSAVLSVGSGSTGGVLYYLSQQPVPILTEPETRAVEAERERQAFVATMLFIGAGVLATTAIVALIAAPSDPSSEPPVVSIVPSPGGLSVYGRF